MRPRQYDNVAKRTSPGGLFHSFADRRSLQRDCRGDYLVDAGSIVSRSRSLSSSKKKRKAGQCRVQRNRHQQEAHTHFSSENKNRRGVKSRRLRSKTLMNSTVASRASTHSFPEGIRKETPLTISSRETPATKKKTSILTRGPVEWDGFDRRESSQWMGRTSTAKYAAADGVAGAMLTVSSNLREVSEHLQSVAAALTESLSLSMSLRNSDISQTPQRNGTDKFQRAVSSVSPNVADYAERTNFDIDMLESQRERDDRSLNDIMLDDEVRRGVAPPGLFPPDSDNVVPDSWLNLIEKSSDTETISDMIKMSVRKKLTDLFST